MKISVIVSVYNSEDYLHRCVEKIILQNYTYYEVLLIDDVNMDRSDEFASLKNN